MFAPAWLTGSRWAEVMQLVYFQFRRFGLAVPFIFVATVALLAAVPKRVEPVWLSDGLYFSACALIIAAIICLVLWRLLRKEEPVQVWDELSETWIVTRDLDEFMYMKFWQWGLFFLGCAITFLIVSAFR